MCLSLPALSQVKMTMREKLKKYKKMNRPKSVAEVEEIFRRASITPIETISVGFITGIILGLIAWIMWSDHTISSFFTYEIVTVTLVMVFGLKNVHEVGHGIIVLFGQRILREAFENGQKSLLSEGWHWLPPLICSARVIDTQERHVEVDDEEFVVPNPKGKKTGIVVKFKGAQANFRVWHPWSLLQTGEADVDNEIVGIINETIRSYATDKVQNGIEEDEGVEKIFAAKVDTKILEKLQDEEVNERWGVFVVSVATPGIGFATTAAKEAFESLYIKQREREAELLESVTITDIADDLMSEKYGFNRDRAFEIAQRVTGNLRKSDIFFTQNGDGHISDVVIAAAIHKILEEGAKNEKEGGKNVKAGGKNEQV
jgi:hypothetical protein